MIGSNPGYLLKFFLLYISLFVQINMYIELHILTFLSTENLFALYYFFAEAMASILGNPNVFIESGSVLNLTCVVKHSITKPAFIIWKHGTKVSKNLISGLCCTQGNPNTDYGRLRRLNCKFFTAIIMIQSQMFLKISET